MCAGGLDHDVHDEVPGMILLVIAAVLQQGAGIQERERPGFEMVVKATLGCTSFAW